VVPPLSSCIEKNVFAVFVSGACHKLVNHMADFGSTDAICIVEDTLVMSGYDIDNGFGYINGIYLLLLQVHMLTDYKNNCNNAALGTFTHTTPKDKM